MERQQRRERSRTYGTDWFSPFDLVDLIELPFLLLRGMGYAARWVWEHLPLDLT